MIPTPRRRRLPPHACAAALVLASPVWAACDGPGPGVAALLEGVPAVVVARRATTAPDGRTAPLAGEQLLDPPRYLPGGGLFVLEPPAPGGELRSLTGTLEGVDVAGFDVSFDGRRVVLSMRHAADDHFHLWTVGVDGGALRQRTFGPWNDVDPAFLPGDRVAFATDEASTPMGTRADEYGRRRGVLQLATMSLGERPDRRRCGEGLGHVGGPFPLSDGRVGFSRWEHRGPVNDVKLFAARPDCTDVVALAGEHGKPANGIAHAHEHEPGVLVGVATARRGTYRTGAIVRIDVGVGQGEGALFDEADARFTLETPAVPVDDAHAPGGVGRYAHPIPLPGRTRALLVSWADGDVNERTELTGRAPELGIYALDLRTGDRALLIDAPGIREVAARPAVPRPAPPVLPPTPAPDAPDAPAVLSGIDVRVTSLDETVDGGPLGGMPLEDALAEARRVRVIEGYSAEVGRGAGFGLTRFDGSAIVAEVPVFDDGSWAVAVPPGLPYAIQVLDAFGMSLRGTTTWIPVAAGETRRCGGCHASRTSPQPSDTPTLAELAGPTDGTGPIRERLEIPWDRAVADPSGLLPHRDLQALFDARCVDCHDGSADELDPTPDPFAGRSYGVSVPGGGTVRVPWLRLTGAALGAGAAGSFDALPASYVSLLFPSTVGDAADVSGRPAPEWIVPGAARRSRLLAKINVSAEDDPSRWAWPTPPHPEDVGGSLTRAERMMIVRAADLGGAFWTRRNVASAARWFTGGE